MPTQYYFKNAAPPGYYPTGTRSTDTDGVTTIPALKYTPLLMSTGAGTSQASGESAYATTTGTTVLQKIWVGPFLSGGQTFTASKSGYAIGIGIMESHVRMDLFHRTFVYVWRSGTGNAKTLIAPQVSPTEADATQEVGSVIYATGQATDFVTNTDDRLIVETWFHVSKTGATVRTGTMYWNGTTDVADNVAVASAGAYLIVPFNLVDYQSIQTLSQNATLKGTTSQTLSQNATLKKSTSQTLSQNAFLKIPSITTSQTINQNAFLKTVTSRTLPQNSTLKTVTTRTLSQNAELKVPGVTTTSQTLQQNATLKTSTSRTVNQNATLKRFTSQTISQNAFLKVPSITTSRTINQNATLKGVTVRTLSQNAGLTYHGYIASQPSGWAWAWWKRGKASWTRRRRRFKQTLELGGQVTGKFKAQLPIRFAVSNRHRSILKLKTEPARRYLQKLALNGHVSNAYSRTLPLVGKVSNKYLRKLGLDGFVGMDSDENAAFQLFLRLLDEDDGGD